MLIVTILSAFCLLIQVVFTYFHLQKNFFIISPILNLIMLILFIMTTVRQYSITATSLPVDYYVLFKVYPLVLSLLAVTVWLIVRWRKQ